MNKTEALAYVRAFMEATGVTNDDLVKPEAPKEPTVDDLCPRKRWVPSVNDDFYLISSFGQVQTYSWHTKSSRVTCLEVGNVFPTKEAAHEHLANMKAWVELRERSCEYSDHVSTFGIFKGGWHVPGVRFETEKARDLAVEAVGGQGRIDKLIKWVNNW